MLNQLLNRILIIYMSWNPLADRIDVKQNSILVWDDFINIYSAQFTRGISLITKFRNGTFIN